MDPNFERRRFSLACPAHGAAAAPLAGGPALDSFRRPTGHRSNHEFNLRLAERQKERAHITRGLHTLFHRFLGASVLLFRAAKERPPDSPSKRTLERDLPLRRFVDEGRHLLDGFRSSAMPTEGLEQALTGLAEELPVEGSRFRIWVMGCPKAFHPAIEKQIYLIVREAVVNALRHSAATNIETDVEYLPGAMRVVVRDNGLGIDQEALRAGGASQRGLVGMRERAENIDARLRIWSRKGVGTEVEIFVPMSSVTVSGPLEEKIPVWARPAENQR